MIELTPEQARGAILEHTRLLAESASEAGPDASVPTAPKWTMADLVEHIGQTQHWTAAIIEDRITDPAKLPTEMAALPAEPARWKEWLSESGRRAAEACSDDVLDVPMFNAAGDERSGGQFWMGNIVNETVIHGFDAANTADRPFDIEPVIAAGLISHHLAMLTSPTWGMQMPESALAIRGIGQRLQWRATDSDEAGAWIIERRPEGARWEHAVRPADVTVSGPARSLLLILTRRISLAAHNADRVRVDGDADLAQHWLDNTAHVAD